MSNTPPPSFYTFSDVVRIYESHIRTILIYLNPNYFDIGQHYD